MGQGIMLCGHGSRSDLAVTQFEELATEIARQMAPIPVEYGFLEFATPTLNQGLDKLKAKADDILAVPGMLFAAGHAKNDIPSVLNAYLKQNPEINLRYGRELGIDLKLLNAACNRIIQADQADDSQYSLQESLLMVIGRGASDPDANSNVCKMARMIAEALGVGWLEVGYSGVTFPLVTPALKHAVKLGYPRIIVFPYFLFSGILIDRIYEHTGAVAAQYPETHFVKASYLGAQEQVVASILERIEEIKQGNNNMNCQLCKYRTQYYGFENEVGLIQQSHHHHVEGIGTNMTQAEKPHTHNHDSANDHHHHHPYPHSQHPLGPLTLKKILAKTIIP